MEWLARKWGPLWGVDSETSCADLLRESNVEERGVETVQRENPPTPPLTLPADPRGFHPNVALSLIHPAETDRALS